MLENVRSFKIKNSLVTVIIFIIFSFKAFSDDIKINIIDNLRNTNSLEFSFNQITNDKIETGTCALLFPKKLKCTYNDKNLKELIINDNRMAILQKRYNKIYHYPLKDSPFLMILNKNYLINLVNKREFKIVKNEINLKYVTENEENIIVLFNKKDFNIRGWLIKDRFNNNINFTLTINNKNTNFKKNYFKIPMIN